MLIAIQWPRSARGQARSKMEMVVRVVVVRVRVRVVAAKVLKQMISVWCWSTMKRR